ncbi:MAG: hypothetical protein ABGX16_04585 [Pirellulales bacterium]
MTKLTLPVSTFMFFVVCLVRTHAEAVESDTFRIPAGQRQLLLDDHTVAQIENLCRRMHRPRKRGAVIRSPNPGQTIQTRSAPAWDPVEKLYKLWVLGIDDMLWQSKDGLHWTAGPNPNMRTDLSVFDPVESDPARRFKAALTNQGFAVSPDGAQWTKLDVPLIQSSDESNFSYDPDEGLFVHTVKRGGKYGRAVAIATSLDFKTWIDLGVVFQADEVDQELCAKNITARMADQSLLQTFHNDPAVYNMDVYNMGVFRYEGLYIGMPSMYHATGPVPNYPNTDGFHLVQLAMSRDLRHWKRLGDRKPFIGPSRIDSGAYDLTQILPPSAPVKRGDELWFYYTGLKYRASYTYVGNFPKGEHIPKPGLDLDSGAVCLAVLRRDGFVSLDADSDGGYVLTKPLELDGELLLLNLDAGETGSAIVELLDDSGEVLADSQPAGGDEVRLPVRWKNPVDLKSLSRSAIQLKIHLRDASLYAFWVE